MSERKPQRNGKPRLINNQLYDPSYGAGPFDSLQAWEDASMLGFWTVEQQLPDALPPELTRSQCHKNPIGSRFELQDFRQTNDGDQQFDDFRSKSRFYSCPLCGWSCV